MEFKSNKIIIDPNDPFENDKLGRKPHVENFTTLLKNISSPIVLSVNAPWGQGKTTFLEMLEGNLQINNCSAIYFSAWETDFVNDPLQAFLGEVNKKIESLVEGDKEKSKAWVKAKSAGAQILKKGLPVLVKLATAGIIDAGKITEAEAAKFTEGLSKDFLDDYTKSKEAITSFKENVSKALKNEDGGASQLFIIIDELDRCRPTYAIELLERIKHLLDIEGLVFVIAMDKLQLSHSVKGVYGAGFEAMGYLRRFIDIEYILPESDLDAFIEQLYKVFEFDIFFQKRTQYQAFRYEKDYLKNTFKLLAKAKKLSLREVEQLFAKVNLVVKSTAENVYLYPDLLAFLIVAKEYYYESYSGYINGGDTPEKLIQVLHSITPSLKSIDSRACAVIESSLIGAKNDEYQGNIGGALKYHEDMSSDESASTDEQNYSHDVVQITKSFDGFRNSIDLESLKQRIEMLESFKFNS